MNHAPKHRTGDHRPASPTTGDRKRKKPAVRPNHVIALMACITALGVLSFLLSHDAIAKYFYPSELAFEDPELATSEVDSATVDISTAPPAAPTDRVPDSSGHWLTVSVANGDNLYSALGRHGFELSDAQRILDAGPGAAMLKRLIPGQHFKVRTADEQLMELVFEHDGINVVHIKRNGVGFEVGNVKRNVETRLSYATGIVDSSLFLAAQQAGLSVNLTVQLANIFGWDVDFALDIRKDDRFTVIYEEVFSNGEKVRDGSVLAAEFVNAGKTYRAVRYLGPEGRADYYTPTGQNLRKAFLRTPVDFSRVSSGFGMRFHPVLNRMRAHRGVDYAAPTGTPIRVTGDGKVTVKGVRSGYGKTIIIDHGNGYETIYAHLSQFRSDLKPGSYVRQGQIIGYVGATGLATGPHLHYEFRVNGVHRDPLTIKLPSASPIAEDEMRDFEDATGRYVNLLDTLNKTNVALSDR
jgi:murein DD-endopeptidase MepM/ murein hydrolase activator NlpD